MVTDNSGNVSDRAAGFHRDLKERTGIKMPLYFGLKTIQPQFSFYPGEIPSSQFPPPECVHCATCTHVLLVPWNINETALNTREKNEAPGPKSLLFFCLVSLLYFFFNSFSIFFLFFRVRIKENREEREGERERNLLIYIEREEMFRLDKFTVSLFSVLFTSLKFFFYAFSRVKVERNREKRGRKTLEIY